ncbi:phosphoribosylanthranilate isomerase [Dasania sp. GY-MA-18]|uniref:N-(5'-phosphoribosyl)anthranilate isomerase n=1 Tax=Dasania phycosphaerae TaxID=2950436 RepID=A0A9J6RI62_9GAMM|nr:MULTISPECIES: phosphoribosylanthranilate isomerase [Dasania]MCR8921719.1 phosphoribosylanthranilate isomerase [Dasania sp. GY-MA-18]MCZ0864147.1 phosphoribosylanthranilate isomerase [Dasania phycosphaerae]MCZ0867875.1 phosphoribosylanthranilate isomerase [Dasania phycosphaerae]
MGVFLEPSLKQGSSVQRTRVKICGITSAADAQLAINAGADAIGLVFYAPSPRAVDIAQAQQICRSLPPFVTVVALLVNAEQAFVSELLSKVPVDLLQFHGDEPAAFCQQFGKPYLKAIRMRPELDLNACFNEYAAASAILLDAYRKGVPGGTGESFDWARIPANRPLPIVLAGGLEADNVAAAIAQVAPYAVDVSGGVEASPGRKDGLKIAAFMQAVTAANSAAK